MGRTANDKVMLLSLVHGVIRRSADIRKLLCLSQSQFSSVDLDTANFCSFLHDLPFVPPYLN